MGRVVHEQGIKEVQAIVIETGYRISYVGTLPLRKRGLVVGKRCDIRPISIGRGTENSKRSLISTEDADTNVPKYIRYDEATKCHELT